LKIRLYSKISRDRYRVVKVIRQQFTKLMLTRISQPRVIQDLEVILVIRDSRATITSSKVLVRIIVLEGIVACVEKQTTQQHKAAVT
jgi:hypothetical protein